MTLSPFRLMDAVMILSNDSLAPGIYRNNIQRVRVFGLSRWHDAHRNLHRPDHVSIEFIIDSLIHLSLFRHTGACRVGFDILNDW